MPANWNTPQPQPQGPIQSSTQGRMGMGIGPSQKWAMAQRGNMMRPNLQRFQGGPDQGKQLGGGGWGGPAVQMGGRMMGPMMGPKPPMDGGMRRPMPQGGGVVGPRPMPQRSQRPEMGGGTGSNSRTSSDWARRHPNDPGPMGPRPDMMQNKFAEMAQQQQLQQQLQQQQAAQQQPAPMQQPQQDPRMMAMQQMQMQQRNPYQQYGRQY